MTHVLLGISLFLSMISLFGIAKMLHSDGFRGLSVSQIVLVWLITSISWSIYSYLLILSI